MGFYKGTLPLKGFYRGTQKAKALYLGTQKIRPDYTELEYIESYSSGGYVNIPYKINYKSKIRAKYMQTDLRGGGGVASVPFGVVNDTPTTNNASNGFIRLLSGNSSFNRVGWGGDVVGTIHDVGNNSFPQNLDTWYEIYYNLNVISVVGYGSETVAFTENWTSGYDFSLFARTQPGGYGMNFIGRIAYFNIEEDGEKTLDLVPAKSSDDKLGYLDKVSGDFYECVGYFTAGPEI